MGIPVFFASHIPGRRRVRCRPGGEFGKRSRISRRIVGVARRRNKGLRETRRQQGRPAQRGNSADVGVVRRWDKGRGELGANRAGRAAGKRRRCWRGPTVGQGLAGCKAPTGPATGRFSRRTVGVVRRWDKGPRGTRRQQGRARAAFLGALLAWSDGGTRACGVPGANRADREPHF